MSGLVCGEGPNCGPLSWNYVDTQLLISAGAWGLFFILGQILAIKSRTSNIDEYRERMEIIVVKLHGSPRILVIELVMSVSSCVLFMFRTYHRSMNEMSFLCEAVACIFYFVLFIPNWAVKHFKGLSSGGFFMLTEGVLELFLLGSMAGLVIVSHEGKKTWFSPSFLASKHFLAAWKRALIAMKVNTSVPATQIMDILVVTIVKVYFMAMLMLTVENLGDPELLKSFTKDKWNTVSSVYFVLTTVTTVGFGDIVPVTSLGRLFTIVIIFGGTSWLAQIAYRGGQIFAVNNSGGGFFVPIPQTKYIVVVGSPGAHMVRNFILELFHPDHSEDSDDLHISLILTPGSPAIEATLQLLKLPENIRINARVHVFQGSALNDDDLLRVTISSATCVFVLPDMLCHNMIQEDTENIIRMMSVQKFAAKTRIILLLMTAENKDLLQEANISSGSNITVVAYDQFKLEMAGKSCQVHGFGPLISNLCKSINIEEEQDAEGYAEDDEEMGEGPPGKPQWKKDFERGAGLELYEVDLSQVYSQRGATFMEVVVDIIEQTGGLVYLIGLVESRPDSKRVLVNPGPMYPIKASTGSLKIMGVFFASDREAILQCDVGMVFLGRRERALADEDTEMMGGGKKRLRNVAMAKFQEEDIPELQHVNLGQAQKETALQIARVVRRHRRALQPVRPPLKMLAVGGHVIVLCVGAQAAEDLRLGMQHFVKPLRNNLDLSELAPVIIMSQVQPRDWFSVESQDQVYFVLGSPTSLIDLQRINFGGAAAIFITHCGAGRGEYSALEDWTVDYEVVCCTRLVESQLPKSSTTIVITDIVNDSNHPYLPLPGSTGFSKAELMTIPQKTDLLEGFKAALKNPRGAIKMGGNAEGGSSDKSVQGEYFVQPRFAAGRLFAGSATFTSLAANTFYNPSLIDLVGAMIATQIIMIHLPHSWEGKTYFELFDHLLWNESLLAIGIYRHADMKLAGDVGDTGAGGRKSKVSSQSSGSGKKSKATKRLGFVYTAPPGKETVLVPEDQIICFQARQDL